MKRKLKRTWEFIPESLDNKLEKKKDQIVFTLRQPSYKEIDLFQEKGEDGKISDDIVTTNILDNFIEDVKNFEVEDLPNPPLRKGYFSQLKEGSGFTPLIQELATEIYTAVKIDPRPLSKRSVNTSGTEQKKE